MLCKYYFNIYLLSYFYAFTVIHLEATTLNLDDSKTPHDLLKKIGAIIIDDENPTRTPFSSLGAFQRIYKNHLPTKKSPMPIKPQCMYEVDYITWSEYIVYKQTILKFDFF